MAHTKSNKPQKVKNPIAKQTSAGPAYVRGGPAVPAVIIKDGQYPEYDETEFSQMKDLGLTLKNEYRDRDTLLDEMEEYWSMIPAVPIPMDTDETAVTYDTDMTNRLMGAHRLLSSTEPEFSIPHEISNTEVVAIASDVERAAKMMWTESGRIKGYPQHKEAVLMALHTGQVDIAITNLMLDPLKKPVDKNGEEYENVAYWRKLAAIEATPLLFEVLNTRQGYVLRDKFGVQAYFRYYETTCAELKAEWEGTYIEFLRDKKPMERIRVWDGITEHYRSVYIDGDKRPFYWWANDKGIVPIVSQVTEGSLLFDKRDLQARPFLYTAHKSNIPQRQSLALTAIYTIVKAIAMTAMWKFIESPNDPAGPIIQAMGPMSILKLKAGSQLEPMLNKGAIDPAIMTMLGLGNAKIGESTIYSQALGEPLGANAPFSMVALLHQAGRLPLTNPKILTGWAIASAMQLGFLWLKSEGKAIKLSTMSEKVELNVSQIPKNIRFDVKLDIDLPQDMRELANVLPAFEGKVSDRWMREHLMRGVGQSELMQEEIWSEQMANQMAQELYQMMQMRQKQAAQEAAAANAEAAGDQARNAAGDAAPVGGGGETQEPPTEAPVEEPVEEPGEAPVRQAQPYRPLR